MPDLLKLVLPTFIDREYLREWLLKEGIFDNEFILALIEIAQKRLKGALFIVSSDMVIREERTRLCCSYNRGICFDKDINLKGKSTEEKEKILSSLSAIDGAVLIDWSGHCSAFGVILDGEAKAKGDMSRGARYNSAVNYLCVMRQRLKEEGRLETDPIIGIVISEDGMVDLLPLEENYA